MLYEFYYSKIPWIQSQHPLSMANRFLHDWFSSEDCQERRLWRSMPGIGTALWGPAMQVLPSTAKEDPSKLLTKMPPPSGSCQSLMGDRQTTLCWYYNVLWWPSAQILGDLRGPFSLTRDAEMVPVKYRDREYALTWNKTTSIVFMCNVIRMV